MRRRKKTIVALILLLAICVLVIVWDNSRIVVTEYTIESNRIKSPTRIVQVSDFHNCERHGEKMIEIIESLSPQAIAITGDFIDGYKADHDHALDIAEQLTRIAPTFFVTGNHEIEDLSSEYRNELKTRGVKILSGDSHVIGNNVEIYGIEDPTMYGDISWQLQQLDPDKGRYNVLLSHRPEAFHLYTQTGFDLVLTGHAHGGQVRIPFVGGIIAPDQGFFPEYDSGSFKGNGTTMIVSRGVGNSILPIRINNPSELVSIDLMPIRQ